MRACERASRAAGKTPDAADRVSGPYARFVRSSLDLFSRLKAAGLALSPPGFLNGVGEVYPGALWTRFGLTLGKKSTPAGVDARRAVLEQLGVRLSEASLTHDQLDAAIAAVTAAAADQRIEVLSVEAVGDPLVVRASGDLEEGPMAMLVVSAALQRRLSSLVMPADSEARSRIEVSPKHPCPIDGCSHVFTGSRGGWDAHVASVRRHPSWFPEVSAPERRKQIFRDELPHFFRS